MGKDVREIVIGLLLHAGGLDAASKEIKDRIIESIAPVDPDEHLWQARDSYIGVSWLIALNAPGIMRLTTYRMDGSCWAPYTPVLNAEVLSESGRTVATVAAFHDTKHDIAPPALLGIEGRYVYRNISGHFVMVENELVDIILEHNGIRQ